MLQKRLILVTIVFTHIIKTYPPYEHAVKNFENVLINYFNPTLITSSFRTKTPEKWKSVLNVMAVLEPEWCLTTDQNDADVAIICLCGIHARIAAHCAHQLDTFVNITNAVIFARAVEKDVLTP